VYRTTLLGRPAYRRRAPGIMEEIILLSAFAYEHPPELPAVTEPKGDELGPIQVPVEPDEGFYLRYGKRLFDLLAGGVLFALFLPLLIFLALSIKLDSPGPVLYRSRRVGRGGKIFTFYKLRSMVRDAEKERERIAHLNEVSGPVFKIANDPRATRIGRILRRTSLDELPQLVNVLRGDMSIVGPRPPIPEEVTHYEPWQLRRLSVKRPQPSWIRGVDAVGHGIRRAKRPRTRLEDSPSDRAGGARRGGGLLIDSRAGFAPPAGRTGIRLELQGAFFSTCSRKIPKGGSSGSL
jgi:hypothetical protein